MSIKYYVKRGSNPTKPDDKNVFQGLRKQTHTFTLDELCNYMNDSCSATPGDIKGVIDNLFYILTTEFAQSNIVRLGDLGTFRPILRYKMADSKELWNRNLIRDVRVVFTPGPKLRATLSKFRYEAYAPASGKKKKPVEPNTDGGDTTDPENPGSGTLED